MDIEIYWKRQGIVPRKGDFREEGVKMEVKSLIKRSMIGMRCQRLDEGKEKGKTGRRVCYEIITKNFNRSHYIRFYSRNNICAGDIICAGSSKKLSVKKLPSKTKVTWKSSNPKVATVKIGKVTGISIGKATIMASAGKRKATCKVTVVLGDKAKKAIKAY